MPKKTKREKLREVHQRALQRFDKVQDALRDERRQCIEDRRFASISGAQWEGDFSKQFENKPRLEVNKLQLAITEIINEYRNNRISVDFQSKDGTHSGALADLCDGLYRADEQDSLAQEAYDNAFEEGSTGGIGAWRLCAEYENDESLDDNRQRIRFEPIYDTDSSVYFDLQCKTQSKKGANWGFIVSSMTPEAYEEEWPDSNISTWNKDDWQCHFDWANHTVIYVAEYYEVVKTKELYVVYEHLNGKTENFKNSDLDDDTIDQLEAVGAVEIRRKRINTKKVFKYILSGEGILEDCGLIAGKSVPIVPYYGRRFYINNIERCMGHVRFAKDIIRLKNMQVSKLAEISAISSVEKPIFTPQQIGPHALMWEQDNIKNYPYLLVDPITDQEGNEIIAPPVAYTKSPQLPPALAALLQLTEQDLQDVLGNKRDGEHMSANISTETAYLIQNKLDMRTFIYMDNFRLAMKRSGEIWLEMAKDLYVEEGRSMKVLDAQDQVGQAFLNKPLMDEFTDEAKYENDLTEADFDVIASVGPASSTRKAATIKQLISILGVTDDPQSKSVITSMIMMNMEGEGMGEVRKFFRRKLIAMKVIEPTDEELQQIAKENEDAKPSAEDEYLKAEAEKARNEAVESQSRVLLNQAKTDETRTKAAKNQADIEKQGAELSLNAIEKLGPRVDPMS